MIFVTLGNVPLPFTRLASEIDRIAPLLEEKVIVQSGHTTYSFANVRAIPFLDNVQMHEAIQNASIVVTHGGWGTIYECLALEKRTVAVPRRKGVEHNHPQSELVSALARREHLLGVYEIETLLKTIEEARCYNFQPLKKGNASKIINEFLQNSFGCGLQ